MQQLFLKISVALFFTASLLVSCTTNNKNIIKQIHVGLHNDNKLKIQLDISTSENAKVYAAYWPDTAGINAKIITPVSENDTAHHLILCNILPQTKYSYQIITNNGITTDTSKIYSFVSEPLPMWMQDQFKTDNRYQSILPGEFKNGLMLLNKRDAPGIMYLVDYKGRIRWYHTVDGEGCKVIHFTKQKTILAILGTNDEPTSYGSQILEVNLYGDTVLYLKKGQGDFQQTIHHEILKNDSGQLVTIFVDKRIIDLSSVGGSKKDTVEGDGILVMNKDGKQISRWSVFDVLDPLKDNSILKNKKDWVHANSLNYDKDSNYIISFYNIGQIWKVNAHTGKVMWKLGKGGDIAMPAECNFTQSHTVHLDPWGNVLFFDNGVQKRQSEVFAMKMNEQAKTSQVALHIKLPKEVYNGRMGSAYMINDTSILCCCSKKHITLLTDRKGVLLWTMEAAIPSYRAEFLKQEQVSPYLVP